MKITKRDRERVAEMLSMLACQPDGWPWVVEYIPGFSSRRREIADKAVAAAADGDCYWAPRWREVYAEAEAMIRTGWSP